MESTAGEWADFNLAIAGAGAALAGLLIVAMSVNIAQILRTATLPSRAGAAIGALTLGMAASCLGLIPGQPGWLLGLEVLAGVVLLWLLEVFAARAILREEGQHAARRVLKVLVGILPPVAFTIGAVMLVAGADSGYGWIGAGSVLAIVGAVLFSWVALVEILR
ncbi:hypothetical protein NCCP1664_12770 [Zafaria cholistanensis]|uniref:Modulator of FtsH protease n=1 Tax=Zafaria cholistanensis TaxID=1682741 RepID=A0A5A7NPQ1_9MICC|nr:hypothetical protein [Zafaria cholistanensis]GER22780.1 hypothetical protein NCCP1664_12770 [Zafaria cholistanensis]